MRERVAGGRRSWISLARMARMACFLLAGLVIRSQPSQSQDLETTTAQRIASERWWPTMSTAPLEAFSGTPSCTRCHVAESSSEPPSSMSQAALRASDNRFLHDASSMTLPSQKSASFEPFTYALSPGANAVQYSVSRGDEKLSQTIDWVMGAGDLGQTFVYQRDDHWYQSRMSLYGNVPKMDLTTGLRSDPNADLISALGKILNPEEVRHCFSCHTVHATTSRGFNPLHAEAGVGCEACHGPGLAHVKKSTDAAGAPVKAIDERVFNPARLSPADSIDLCGACHRTSADVTSSANNANDASVVRFQPYRLEMSRCWLETRSAKVTCTACHDPHEALNHNIASYDRHCIECHSAPDTAEPHVGKSCPKAKSQCVRCHMPKVAVPSMHGEFTDHFIRVVKPSAEFIP